MSIKGLPLSAATLLLVMCGCAAGLAPSSAALPSTHRDATALGSYLRLPAADARYRDADPNARATPRMDPANEQHLARSANSAMGPSASAIDMARQGYLLSLRGDREGAIAALDEARSRYPDNGHVYWSLGWVWLNLDEPEAALEAWQIAEGIHGGEPAWVPYSKAIALMALNDETAALAWWHVARASLPYELGTATRAQQTFSYWRPKERALLRRLTELAYVR